MGQEILTALKLLEEERGISVDFMLKKILRAIATGCKNTHGGNDEITVKMNEKTGEFEVGVILHIVEEVELPDFEISLKDAKKIDPGVKIGGIIENKIETKEFGRIAAQTARNMIRQGIKDGEKENIIKEFQDKVHQIASAYVEKIDPITGIFTLKIGKAETVLMPFDQIGTEHVKEGDFVKVYVAEVKALGKGPKIMVSRTHPEFLKKLFHAEIPEIANGVVVIKGISREAGARAKVALWSNDPNIEAIGSCIGTHGTRVNAIVKELGGEKIDLIEYSENPEEYIAAALAPARVLKVEIEDSEPLYEHLKGNCEATVPDNQLSLAIGAKGQNVRLAARLTGYKIDIRPESGYYGE